MQTPEIPSPQIWVDADACPAVIKEILFRAAERAKIMVTLVANHALPRPSSRFIRSVTVQGGFDVADNEIVERMHAGDLVVTQDIPLAARVIEKGGVAINPRGERYTPENMAERLSMRNFMEELRGAGVQTGGPSAFHMRDRQSFANQLDRWLAQHINRNASPNA
ncbi:YaiI/YqxD family protein [Dyella sp. 2HG41-7]|uniref:YaiI/YqxD family protein n=1 Tax=Dyella sp. 2HG41-7 TaxID=2883239 RepID=UPI001F47247E|nr:YaiI/YqxD family protein [Dyella sp. 2HG41-7]